MSMLALALAVLQAAMMYQADERENSLPLFHMQGKVVDASHNPLADVSIVTSFVHDPSYPASVFKTDATGEFKIDSEPSDSGSLQAFFHKPGYACEYSETYEPHRKPFRIQLEPEILVQLRVVDGDGKPVKGASVSPSEIEFDNDLAIAQIDDRSLEAFHMVGITNESGLATLHGIRPKMLWAVRVKVPGYAPSYFRVRNVSATESNEVMELRWRPFSNHIKCKITEANGEPITDAYLIVMSKEEEWNVQDVNTPIAYVSLLKKLDERGLAEIDVACDLVELKVFSFRRGISDSLGFFNVVDGGTTEANFQLPPTSRIVVSVVDLSNPQGDGHSGLTISLRKKSGRSYTFVSGVTNEDGIAEIDVLPGDWEFADIRGELPSGLVFDNAPFRVKVTEPNVQTVAPPIALRSGRVITGYIAGVDIAALRFDFVFVTYQKGEIEKEVQGKVDLQGNFSVTLPDNVEDSQITNFEISHAPTTNRRSLAVRSRKPWRLEWIADEQGEVGLVLKSDGQGAVRIENILPNSPASRCPQLTLGTRLVSISDDDHAKTELTGMKADDVESILRGPIGSRLTLRVIPPGRESQGTISVSMRRGRVITE